MLKTCGSRIQLSVIKMIILFSLVYIVVRNEEQCKSINENHRNNRYLKDYVLLDNIFATTNPEEALAGNFFSRIAIYFLLIIIYRLRINCSRNSCAKQLQIFIRY